MKKEVRQTVRFPGEVYSKLRKVAEREDRSINWEVIAAVKLLIEQHENKHGPLEE